MSIAMVGAFVRRHIIGVVALFVALGGTSYAAVGVATKNEKTYYACVTTAHKTLNLSSKSGKCPSGQRKISFSAEGTQGATGAAGATGATGAAGANGVPGAKGADGEQGPAGPSVFGSPGTKGEVGAQGEVGPQGDIGATGLKGDIGNTGAAGPKGDTGTPGAKGDKGDTGNPGSTGATGAKGDTGAVGPVGPAGGGVKLIDGNNVTLGTMIGTTASIATIATSNGYQVEISWDAKFQPGQIFYTGAGCTGTAYLNDGKNGNGPFEPIFGKLVVFSRAFNSLMAPATVTNGFSTGESFTAATFDNPGCVNSPGTASGWKLATITRATIGLPATIATPLYFG